MAAYKVVTDWLVQHAGPLIVGMDANTPWEDPWDLRTSGRLPDDPWFEDARLFGFDKAHDLRDAWREWLLAHPSELERILRLRPQGPLAITHNRGSGGSTLGCRYDHLLISESVSARDMGFVLADAIGAGSDHALVWAEVTLTTDATDPSA